MTCTIPITGFTGLTIEQIEVLIGRPLPPFDGVSFADWDPMEHPRDTEGKFARKNALKRLRESLDKLKRRWAELEEEGTQNHRRIDQLVTEIGLSAQAKGLGLAHDDEDREAMIAERDRLRARNEEIAEALPKIEAQIEKLERDVRVADVEYQLGLAKEALPGLESRTKELEDQRFETLKNYNAAMERYMLATQSVRQDEKLDRMLDPEIKALRAETLRYGEQQKQIEDEYQKTYDLIRTLRKDIQTLEARRDVMKLGKRPIEGPPPRLGLTEVKMPEQEPYWMYEPKATDAGPPRHPDQELGREMSGYGKLTAEGLKSRVMSGLAEQLVNDADFERVIEEWQNLNGRGKADDYELRATENTVDGLIGSWAATSSDGDKLAHLLQEATAEEFDIDKGPYIGEEGYVRHRLVHGLGMPDPVTFDFDQQEPGESAWGTLPKITREQVDKAAEGPRREYRKLREDEQLFRGLRKFVRAQYEWTQEELERRGITEVFAVRGMRVEKDIGRRLRPRCTRRGCDPEPDVVVQPRLRDRL